ncbi:MAG: EAL domain-containing protein [Lachnospiraceae bacterium]|nr:EAL domain-containing protein [Lachnospiraceae bacterium]
MTKTYQLEENERSLLEHSKVPLAIYQFIDRHVVTVLLSDGFLGLFGFADRSEACLVMNTDMYHDTHPDDVARISDAAYVFATEGGRYDVIYRSLNCEGKGYNVIHAMGEHSVMPDGTRLAWVWYTYEGLYNEENCIGQSDISRLFNMSLRDTRLIHENYYDHLTGLPGMTYFLQLAESGRTVMWEQGKRPAILFMDLNGMQYFNRDNGFAEGNRLLQGFARLMIRYFDSNCSSRFGQDHFAVFTYEEGLEDKLRRFFEDCRGLNKGNNLTVRVGIYQDSAETVDVSTACDRAKRACDAIRSSYESAFNYYTKSLSDAADMKQYIIANLDQALENRWITVFYQPIVRAVNGNVCDEEALARWIDPEKGFLSPGDFIPVLEEAGLLYKMDLYVLDRVLEKLQAQKEAGYFVVPQSINLSRSDFDACDMVEEIRKRVDASGFGRDKITIEITESIIGSDFDFMKKQIERFISLGFNVWMDDFGSGYSSLDMLQSIKFNLIKFDMRFMQQFDESQSSRIVLTELMKLATALGTDTVCEGVETAEQVRFLQEIGCSKIQGFYYQKPIPWEKVREKYENGTQIGFENPAESAYYEALGRVNLYDLSVISQEEEKVFQNFFSTLPMAVMEVKDGKVFFVRSSQSYRDFMQRFFGIHMTTGGGSTYTAVSVGLSPMFTDMVRECCLYGNRSFIDETMPDGSLVHTFVRRLAINPVTGTAAIVIVILSVTDNRNETTYIEIARSLTADYFNLFHVNMDDETFTEYSSQSGEETIFMERHGKNFFAEARNDAKVLLHPEDCDAFAAAFTKERELDEQGVFTYTYRLMRDGAPLYVNMKAMRMKHTGNHLIIGVSNVDRQIKERTELQKMRQEQIAYKRMMALSGDYICIYTVDPATSHYVEFSATEDYDGYGFAASGDDFFESSVKNALVAVHPDDIPKYMKRLTRENILRDIEEKGAFVMRYRLVFNGVSKPVELRAVKVSEADGEKIIVGVKSDV